MAVARRSKTRPAGALTNLAAVPWEDVLENLSDAVLLLSASGLVVSCNPAGELLFDKPQTQLRGQRFAALFGDNPAVVGLVQRTIESAQTQALSDETLAVGERRHLIRIVTS